jgi:phosphoribosylformylglycinamidine synthase I
MKFGVVVFPGSNCDRDTIYVLRDIYGHDTVPLWHKDTDLQNCDFIFIPGGFAYGDYLRCGAVARFSPIMESVIGFANDGGYVMGICNGFQVLCEANLLPGVLLRNSSQKFICKNINLKVESFDSVITSGVPEGKILKIPIAHAEGRFFADDKTITELKKNDQVLFSYCGDDGKSNESSNPNGTMQNIAGICNEGRNVFGMMPHPERAADEALGNTDGRLIFDSILNGVLQNSL